jgi:DNA-binding SARP family transcriptional activator
LERWLNTHAGLPVRLIIAPAGTGKTTLALQYVSATSALGAYCALPEHATPADFIASVASALNLAKTPPTYVELLVAMRRAATKPLELVIDDVDHADDEARALALKLVENLPENISLIYCSRTRDSVDAKRWVARGLAAMCDARRLAFDASEVALFADACGVTYSNAEISRLLDESDGWAIVTTGAVRAAEENERSLCEAYDRWRAAYGEVFLDFVIADAERATPEDHALVQTLIYGKGIADEKALPRLESRGLFVINDGGVLRPFKALHQARSVPVHDVETSIPLVARMLGRFSVSISGREVEWIRRRDQQIVKYLLVRQGASATRAEIAALFWPGVEKQLASQSVRTACSNIRKALASVVGYSRVDRYFRASHTILIDLSTVVTDAGRFTAHAMAGDSTYAAGDMLEATQHYEAAEKIYAGRLYDEDAVEPWFAQSARALEERLGLVLERLAEAAYAKGDIKHAAEYAYRAKLIHPDQPGVLRLLSRITDQSRPA